MDLENLVELLEMLHCANLSYYVCDHHLYVIVPGQEPTEFVFSFDN